MIVSYDPRERTCVEDIKWEYMKNRLTISTSKPIAEILFYFQTLSIIKTTIKFEEYWLVWPRNCNYLFNLSLWHIYDFYKIKLTDEGFVSLLSCCQGCHPFV